MTGAGDDVDFADDPNVRLVAFREAPPDNFEWDDVARATQDVRDGLHCDLAAMQTPQQQDQAVNDTLERLGRGWRLVPPDHHNDDACPHPFPLAVASGDVDRLAAQRARAAEALTHSRKRQGMTRDEREADSKAASER